MAAEIVEKLKRNRGYNDGRIRPYPFDQTQWIAETFIPGRTAKKTWKVLGVMISNPEKCTLSR